jgi:hypothetical protein
MMKRGGLRPLWQYLATNDWETDSQSTWYAWSTGKKGTKLELWTVGVDSEGVAYTYCVE